MYELNLLEDMIGGIETYRDYCKANEIDEIKKCPICHVSISPDFICNIMPKGEASNLYLMFMCPQCEKIFTAYYEFVDMEERGKPWGYELKDTFPKSSENKNFEDEIKTISLMFSKVYNQASKAEACDLGEIAGMGYRKSLEYLIKDYIIYRNPEKREEVERMMLGKCIKDLVTNPKIKNMAKGAVWIGNDETHYVKKWEDKDIEDLKRLIDLTVYWITFEMKTEEYEKIMKL